MIADLADFKIPGCFLQPFFYKAFIFRLWLIFPFQTFSFQIATQGINIG